MPASSSQAARESPARRQRRRRTHRRSDSNGELLGNCDEDEVPASPGRARKGNHERRSLRTPRREQTGTSRIALSSEQLARLDRLNQNQGWSEYDQVPQPRRVTRDDEARQEEEREERRERKREERRERERQRRKEERRRRRQEDAAAEATFDESEREGLTHAHIKSRRRSPRRSERPERRVASGQALERGMGRYYSEKEEFRDDIREGISSSVLATEEDERKRKRKRNILICVAVLIILLGIIIPVAVVVSKKKGGNSGGDAGDTSSSTGATKPSNSNLNGVSKDSIPQSAQGTVLDPFTWYDTDDFNVTYTDATVGGLSIMGLNSSWDDSKRPNNNVPPLNEPFAYGTMPIRGVNVGGWLSIEPFITPSLFNHFTTSDGVIDEWTLTKTLGGQAKSTIEPHYSSWVQESTFADIQAAGFDHVRIPFSYWAVTTYEGDPYVPLVSWRYLLRGIEWARKYGLRINLDLHGAPGSQNGWNHSGRQGEIRWLNGTDGTLNGDRTIDIHKQLSAFFTQPRYKNIITMYGLVNEPRMVELDEDTVLAWTKEATAAVQGNNFTGIVIFGDGFMGLDKWQGQLQGINDLLLDVHQYVIFNVDQIVLDHHDKINFACGGWTAQAVRSENKATGFGPTLCGEWSQADTDCATYLNNVGVGSRWEGTLNMIDTPGGNTNGSVLSPTCPTHNNPRCSCEGANASPSDWSDQYKQWLLMFAEAQMHSFEQGWGWFYWTWETESAAQWSYKTSLAAGTMPQLAYQRSFNCSTDIPDFQGLPEYY